MHAFRSLLIPVSVLALFGAILGGCAQAADPVDDVSPQGGSGGESDDASACLCVPGKSSACDCAGGLKGVQACQKDCRSYDQCQCTGGTGGKGGAGGSAGSGGASGTAGVGGSSGSAGAGGSSSCVPGSKPEDICPGVAITLTGTGTATRTGSASGDTSKLCPNFEGTCAPSKEADAVYVVTPDVDGKMIIELGGEFATPFDSVVYVRTTCDQSTAEVACQDTYELGAEKVVMAVTKGVPYYVFVDGYYGQFGTYELNVQVKPTVPMDICPGVPITLTGTGIATRTGSASGSTVSLDDDYVGTCGTATDLGKDAVFSVVADVAGTLSIDLGGATSTAFDAAVYARSTCGDTASEKKCNDAYTDGTDKISFETVAGTTYYIFVDGSSSFENGSFVVNAKLVPFGCGNGTKEGTEGCDDGNIVGGDGCSATCTLEPAGASDKCPGAELKLTSSNGKLIGAASGTTVNLANDYAPKSCATYATGGPDAVFSFNSGAGGKAIAILTRPPTDFDAVIYVRKDCAATTDYACNDGGTATVGDKVTFDALPNTNYWIFVDGYSGSGNFKVDLEITPPVCGNGIVEAGEDCDDQNTVETDGCLLTCKWQSAGANDVCPGQEIVLAASASKLVGSVSATTANLGDNFKAICGASSATAKDAVYFFHAAVAGEVTATLTSSVDMVLSARASCSATTDIKCSDPGKVVFTAEANKDYWLYVDGYSSASGTFKLDVQLAPPVCGNGIIEPGEQCDDTNTNIGDGCSASCQWEAAGPIDTCVGMPITLTSNAGKLTGTFSGTTANLVDDYKSAVCGSTTAAAKDAVLSFDSGPTGGMAVITLAKTITAFDSIVYVRSGPCATGKEITCNDAGGLGGDTVKFNAAAATTYYVFVDGYSTGSGQFKVDVEVTPAVCGNGIVEGSEQCDDNNIKINDGCDGSCAWEGSCGKLIETEPNTYDGPNVIPAACGTFIVTGAIDSSVDSDHYLVNLSAGAVITASTFVDAPGLCKIGNDTVLSLWTSPMPASVGELGCSSLTSAKVCNDNDSAITPCSKFTYTVPAPQAGLFVLRVHKYLGNATIPAYGLAVRIE